MVNVGSLLTSVAKRQPERPAITWRERSLTYREVEDRASRVAASLMARGLKRGDRVAFISHNRPELLEVLLGVLKAGLCAVPLNSRFAPSEIRYHLEDSGAAAVFFEVDFDEHVREAIDGLDTSPMLVCIGESSDGALRNGGAGAYEEEVAGVAALSRAVDVEDEEIAWLFYTSGTTGRPKGAMLSHGNLSAMIVAWCADLSQLRRDDTTLHCAPLTHGAGFLALVSAARGAHQVITGTGTYDPTEIMALCEEHRVTNMFMVPTQIRRLVQADDFRSDALSHVHSIVYGGAPFHVEDLKEAISALGSILVQIYGQGETPMTGTYLPQEEHVFDDELAVERLGSAGYVRTGLDVKVHDPSGQELPPGEDGEIVVKGPTVMKGYWGRPDESKETLRDGWLHTGDVGQFDEGGYLFILDRLKDMIISGGANIYAREVEEALLSHPDVSAVAIVGVPDRDWGERVVAAVVPTPGSTIEKQTLDKHCKARLASYKKPSEYRVVEELPVSAYGKVLKRELRAEWSNDD